MRKGSGRKLLYKVSRLPLLILLTKEAFEDSTYISSKQSISLSLGTRKELRRLVYKSKETQKAFRRRRIKG